MDQGELLLTVNEPGTMDFKQAMKGVLRAKGSAAVRYGIGALQSVSE